MRHIVVSPRLAGLPESMSEETLKKSTYVWVDELNYVVVWNIRDEHGAQLLKVASWAEWVSRKKVKEK